MRFALSWLGELCALPDDPRRVADALTARGLTVDALEPLAGDWVLDVDVPANRPDCLGHRGLARELAAAFGAALGPSAAALERAGEHAALRVRIDEPELCTRFTALVLRGVAVGPSPAAVRRRLEACGVRPIHNVVDATNLVLLETGHPIHAFDLAALRGAELRVRRAHEGEFLRTLDGVERRLDPQLLVVADGGGAVGLAGVMGGADSEIREQTRDVVVEAAWFAPHAVRRASRRLGLVTEASQRFARGADPTGVYAAQALAARKIAELAGGRAEPPLVDLGTAHPAPRVLRLRRSQIRRLLGYAPSFAEVLRALAALDLSPTPALPAATGVEPDEVAVRVPSFRIDLEREADLVEEVARHLGYDRIPTLRTAEVIDWSPDPRAELEDAVRDRLSQLGFHEALGYAMIGPDEDAPFVPPDAAPALALENPLSETLGVLRRSLGPGLLRALDLNLRRGVDDVRLFEVEHVFRDDEPGKRPQEPAHVAFVWTGAARPRHFSEPTREVDLYDVAGCVEALLDHVRPGITLRRASGGVPGLHPGRCWRWAANGRELAVAGQLHPDLAARLDLARAVHLAEIDLDEVAAERETPLSVAPPPRLGSVARDLAVVLPAGVSFEIVREALAAVPAPAAARIEAVDRYVGPPLAPGASSITVRVTLQPSEGPLTQAEIEAYRAALVAALEARPGISLRL